jgi:hypothetical protein
MAIRAWYRNNSFTSKLIILVAVFCMLMSILFTLLNGPV